MSEPTTMLTDYVLAVVSLAYSLALFNTGRRGEKKSVRLWGWGFLVLAAAALVGGSFHGWAFYLTASLQQAFWNATIYLIGAASALMVAGTAVARISRRDASARWLLAGLGLSLVGFFVQQSSLNLRANFNHNDLYHVIQIVALWPFYRGAKLLEDR